MIETITELKRQQSLGRIRQYGFCNFGEQDIKDFYTAGGVSCSNQVHTGCLKEHTNLNIYLNCMVGQQEEPQTHNVHERK